MRWDVETASADIVAGYLKAKACQQTQGNSPIVTFYDPMSIDEANRIVVIVPNADTENFLTGNGTAMVEVGIKTKWTQKKAIKDDFDNHFSRVNEIRDLLFSGTLIDDMNALNTAGIVVLYVKPQRSFSTKVVDQWIYSETGFQMKFYLTTENQ